VETTNWEENDIPVTTGWNECIGASQLAFLWVLGRKKNVKEENKQNIATIL
jgi:hypothetical protein